MGEVAPRRVGDQTCEARVAVHRSAHRVELRVDGALASVYAPARGSTGLVWQAIAAPWLALPPHRRRTLLILGLGGGSTARVVRALTPQAVIVGVECSPAVVEAARTRFDLDELRVEVIVENALSYLRREHRRFDAVIEDVFVGTTRTIRKPEWLPSPGLELASRRLRANGVLITSTIHETAAVARHLLAFRKTLVVLSVAGYRNRVLASGPRTLTARRLRAALASQPLLAERLRFFRVRTLRR